MKIVQVFWNPRWGKQNWPQGTCKNGHGQIESRIDSLREMNVFFADVNIEVTSSDSSTARGRTQNQINLLQKRMFLYTIRTYVTDNNYYNADNFDKDYTW
jgi:hypothetical protein